MGRLTLNVLLSFAQFEREVTAERIRDKIAVSKKKGLWMGGVPPLGYDPHPDPNTRELVVNADEARTVQALFDLYDTHGSLAHVEREADELGLRSKHHRFRSGREQGGNRMSGGQIHKILLNPVYIGKTRHKDRLWPGKHAAIIDEGLWDRVQKKLQLAARRPRGRTDGASEPALLMGKLRDETGDRLTPTHSTKSGRRHRYYVSNRLLTGGPDPTGWRLPAARLEKTLADLIADHLKSASAGRRLLAMPDLRGDGALQQEADALVDRLRQRDRRTIHDLLACGSIAATSITLTLDQTILAGTLGAAMEDLAPGLHEIEMPLRLRRRGVEAKLVIGAPRPAPDPILMRALGDAHRWRQALLDGTPLSAIAQETDCTGAFIRKRSPLAFLSPRIQIAIRDGTLPPDMTLQRIVSRTMPLDWQQQERLVGL
jgi:hypothetical protein